MEKYGFIYLWFDRKFKKFYIGRHWGHENDGYVCSSVNMRNNYKNRPQDFKRKIISKVLEKEKLILEEQKWLNFIKPNELKRKYYNVTRFATTPSTLGYNHSPETIEKIRLGNLGKKQSEETKQKLREANKKQFENEEQRESRRKKSKELWVNPEFIKKQNEKRSMPGYYKGFNKNHSDETKMKISESKKGISVHTEERKELFRKIARESIWINNGIINKRINKNIEIPNGFERGKL